MSNYLKLDAGSFTANLLKVLEEYWEGFIYVLPKIGIALLIIFAAWFVAAQVKKFIDNRFASQAHNPISVLFISKVVKIAILILGLLLALQTMGLSGIAGGLLAGAGVSAFIIGFAFKDIGENFLAGFILAFNAPFKEGDAIQVQDYLGYIENLNMRTTHLKTLDSKDVYIPNATMLTSEVINLTQNNLLRLDFLIGIDYSDDVDAAETLILDTMKNTPEVLEQPEAFVATEELATNTINIRAYFWTDTDDYRRGVLSLKSKVIKKVKKALVENKFNLPANIQEIKNYQDAPLTINVKREE